MKNENRTPPLLLLLLLALAAALVYLAIDAGAIAALGDLLNHGAALAASAVDSARAMVSAAARLLVTMVFFGMVAGMTWLLFKGAGRIENKITEEEAYYYYDYPDDN